MKQKYPKSWVTAMGAGLVVSAALLAQAHAELVFESDVTSPGHAAQIEDRTAEHQAISASEKAQATLKVTPPSPVETQSGVVTTSSAAAPAAPSAVETQNFSKAELMRRERQREEIKNEDLLQTRLEELRLRDERRRTDEVLGQNGAPVAAGALKEEIVVAPVTEHPGAPGKTPETQAVLASTGTSDSMNVSASSVSARSESSSERTSISVAPHAGLSNMVGNQNYFDVRPHYAAGLSARISASDNISFELGYTLNEYGVAMASSNPFVLNRQAQAAMTGQSAFESVAMKQNVFDAGLKLHLLGPDSKLRPFMGGGGAYTKSFINFDPTVLGDINRAYGTNVSPDYEVSGFLGYLTTGMDVRVAKNISVGAEFKYYAVLSARESQNFSNYYGAMYAAPYSFAGVSPQGPDTAVAGGSLARSSFYTILGSATFTF